MRQLGLDGEIEWTVAQQAPGKFDFRVARPGRIIEVKTDLAERRASVHQIQTNAWGVFHMLHTFSGVRMNDPKQKRDWLLTRAWSLSMDAVAVGLIFMVLSSYYMWYRLPDKRRWGLIFLALGGASCGFFVVGLRWL